MPRREWFPFLLARNQRPEDAYGALGSIGKGVGHEWVVTRLPQPQLEDAAASDRYVHSLNSRQRAGL